MKLQYTKFETIETEISISIKNPFLIGMAENKNFEMIGCLGEYVITVLSHGISMRRISGFPEAYFIDFCRNHKDVSEISPEEFLDGVIDRQNKIQDLIEVSRKILLDKKSIKEKNNAKTKR